MNSHIDKYKKHAIWHLLKEMARLAKGFPAANAERYPFIIKSCNVPRVKINTMIGGGEWERRHRNPQHISLRNSD